MSDGILVELDQKLLSQAKKTLIRYGQEKDFYKAIRNAANRAAVAGRAAYKKQTKSLYTLSNKKGSKLNSEMFLKLTKAAGENGASLHLSRKIMKTSEFLFDPKEPKHNTNVALEILKGRKKTNTKWFVAKMESGHVGVFMRESSAGKREMKRGRYKGRIKTRNIKGEPLLRQPIRELNAPSLAGIGNNKAVSKFTIERVREIMQKRLNHELERAIKK